MSQERNTRPGDDTLLERPLTARSIMASLLLGMHPPRLSSARLVRWCSLFGVSEGTARVALSRMVERGELAAARGVYELSGALRGRQPAQDWVLTPEPRPWDGSWLLGLVVTEARSPAARAGFRAAAAPARLAEVRDGVWARPDNLPRAAAPAAAWAVLDTQCRWWSATPGSATEALVDDLFRPAAWAQRAALLIERLAQVVGALDDGDHERLAEGFVVGAASLQHLRRDWLLPAELLPVGWPGDGLRAAYRSYEAAYAQSVALFLS